MSPEFVVVVAIIGVAVAVIVSYNRFVAQRAGIDSSWSGIDVELQRRHDLVPNLVATVEGYAAHEQQVLTAVTEARAQAVSADRDPTVGPAAQARAERELTAGLRSLFAVAEGYPDLRASRAFQDLHAQLIETEDRIAATRRLYNIEVMHYNRRIEAIPSNLVATVCGFERREFFELEDPAYATPPAV